MSYSIQVYPEAADPIRMLPRGASGALGAVMDVLALTPWNGEPYDEDVPDGAMRTWGFGPHGEGIVTYLILERQRRVDVLDVTWLVDSGVVAESPLHPDPRS